MANNFHERRVLVAVVYCLFTLATSMPQLKVGFYQKTCPAAETIVMDAVKRARLADPGVSAALIRLHFHDCFVRGCDGSVLLDSTGNNKAEKDHPRNLGIDGFDVIADAKAKIEAQCPGIVSCADIVAFAARDGVQTAGGISYPVPAGRRDGKVSLAADVPNNIPGPFFDLVQLTNNFARKGLSLDEMVTLSGAHSIGKSHCSAFSKRLYSFSSPNLQDPSLNGTYADFLKTKCPRSGNADPTVSLDPVTPDSLDITYYDNLRVGKGLLASDQVLWSMPVTREIVHNNVNHPSAWAKKFADAMVHMGSVEVLTGNQGEIRKNCRVVN